MDPKGKQSQQQSVDMESTKVSGIEGSPGLTRIVASSTAPAPGHWRAKKFWPAGEPAAADLTPKQVEQLKADPRIRILNDIVRPDVKVQTTEEVVQKRQDAIKTEMDKMVNEGIRAKAVENVRNRGTQTAAQETKNVPGWQDKRSR